VLRPTNIAQAIATILSAFDQLIPISQLDLVQFPINEAREQLHSICLHSWRTANQAISSALSNQVGFFFIKPLCKSKLIGCLSPSIVLVLIKQAIMHALFV
jgi:hypothetical protein